MPGELGVADGQAGDGQPDQRGGDDDAPFDRCRSERPAIRRIARATRTAAASPMASAQANWATSGRANGGRSGSARENVPSPVHESRPMKTSVPMPERQQARQQDRPQHRPADADGLHEQECAAERGAEAGR